LRNGAVYKSGFWFKVKAAARIKPEEYIRYFEDLIRTPNAEIGPKDNLETAPNWGTDTVINMTGQAKTPKNLT
jgi:hypothetical protein